jgi:hypothetical protein
MAGSLLYGALHTKVLIRLSSARILLLGDNGSVER